MADTTACPACGAGNGLDRKFCGECGSPLTRPCPSCGTANPPLALPFYLATTQLEYAEWLEGQGRTGELEPVAAEARQIFDQLGARPLLERSERIAGAAPVPA